jgi:hypothetical protein
LQENKLGEICDMPIEPSPHFLISPSPLKGMSIKLIVFGPSGLDLFDQLLAAVPRTALEVTQTESVIEQFGLIEPGGMDRGKAWAPPGMVFEVLGGGASGMAGITVLDQKHTV